MALLALGALPLTQCAASPPPSVGAEHCGGVTCNGKADCETALPVCGQYTSSTCLPSGVCAWKLAISATCPCMQHDVRLCMNGATPGVQICTASGSSTYWAACIACPGCT